MIKKSIGKYRIIGQQERGAIGTIYRAVDGSLGREVAIKILSADLEQSDVLERFRAEAGVVASLNHHEHSAIYEVVSVDRDLLIVMEPVHGESFDELSKRSGPLPPERAAYLVWQVLGALVPAHNAGIIHGDIQPSNLIVIDGAHIKVFDFGFAGIAAAGLSKSDDSLMGTPVYTAPEQLLSEPVDGRADLYSCGVVFYRLLTGTLPFKASNRTKLMRSILQDEPTPASTYQPDLPEWCGAIITKALAKARVDRFQTAEEFRTALMNAIGSAAGLTPRTLVTPAIFEGAPTVVRPTARVAPAAPAPAPVAPPPAPIAASAPIEPPPVPMTPAVASAPTSTASAPATSAPASIASAAAPVVPPAPPKAPAVLPPQRSAVPKPAPRSPFLIAGAVLAVIILAAVAYKFSAAPAPTASEVTTGATASPTVTPAAPADAPAPPASTPSSATTATPPDSGRVADLSAPAATPPPTVPAPPISAASPVNAAPPVKKAPAPAKVPAPPAKSAEVFPRLVFEAGAVVADSDKKNRERDGKIVLADGTVTVAEKNDRVLATFPFDRIENISYSTTRNPLWNSPAGPAELLRVEGGAFGIRRGGRNWMAIRTSDAVHVIRVRDEDAHNLIVALEARTGRPVERVVEKKD